MLSSLDFVPGTIQYSAIRVSCSRNPRETVMEFELWHTSTYGESDALITATRQSLVMRYAFGNAYLCISFISISRI